MQESHGFDTRAIRIQSDKSHNREHATPIYMTSSFVFDDATQGQMLFADELEGNLYTRFSNPNTDEFVRKVCSLEGAKDGVATASGMSAVFSTMASLLNSGDHVLASRSLFGSTLQILNKILPRWGIKVSFGDLARPESFKENLRPETKLIFVETPSNPALDLIDIRLLSELARENDALLAVDNTFSTPCLQKPLDLGAHLSIHSATKFIDGQGRAVGGVVVGAEEPVSKIRFFCRHSGPALSPFHAWIFSRSLETLSLRMERHCDSAERLAAYLQEHPAVESVRYPFLPNDPMYDLARKQMKRGGGVVSFVVKGGARRAMALLDSLTTSSLTANLGDTRTIYTHPASTTHSKVPEEERLATAIFPGLVRISVGLEDAEDLLQELEQALERSEGEAG